MTSIPTTLVVALIAIAMIVAPLVASTPLAPCFLMMLAQVSMIEE